MQLEITSPRPLLPQKSPRSPLEGGPRKVSSLQTSQDSELEGNLDFFFPLVPASPLHGNSL